MLPAYPQGAAEPGRAWRPLLLAVLLAAAAVAPAAVPVPAPAAVAGWSSPPAPALPPPPRVPALWMPVTGPLARGFDARAGSYGPGHRGIDVAAPVGELVRAPAAGEVVFAGPVAGVGWVTIMAAPGVLVTLGPLLDPPVPGARLRARAPVGRLVPGHAVVPAGGSGGVRGGRAALPGGPGAGGATLHLGVRVDGVYVDPLAYLVDRPRARLAPLPAPGGRSGG